MKQTFITFLIALIISLGANAQYNYHYSGLGKRTWNHPHQDITVTIDIAVDSLYKVFHNPNWVTFGLYFKYDISFYKNGKRIPNIPNYFNTLNIYFGCEDGFTYHSLNQEISIHGYSGKGLAYNNQNFSNPSNAINETLESISCNSIRLVVGAPGLQDNLIINPSSSLPIELITFDAYKKDREVELIWKTASELNNDYFTIERSADGFVWENLQTIQGAGNSTQVLDYAWTDLSPYAGISYYRLKQTDYDGTTEVFNIVSVEQKEVEELQAYPNPVSHTSTLLGVDENLAVRIFNTVGVEVTGNVNISNSPSKKTLLDMSQLPKGMYYVVNGDESIRLIKK